MSILSNKKILYVHGFASSGQSGTVKCMRELIPEATIVAPDLSLHPQEAMQTLADTCQRECPDLIIGTSMGGMYAEMLYGYDRVLVNPAFQVGDTMIKNGMLGKNTFLSPRQDGVQDFIVTKSLVEEYKQLTKHNFEHAGQPGEQARVWALFGDKDNVVDTRAIYESHYTNAVSFHGEHRMNDKVLIHSVIPVLRWIDDRQEGRERPVVYIHINALRDETGHQRSSAMKAFYWLLNYYTIFIVAPSPSYDAPYIAGVQAWVNDIVNVPSYNHLLFTNRMDLVYGDYLIAPAEEEDRGSFMGTTIEFGSDTFKTWEAILEFFERLGGQ